MTPITALTDVSRAFDRLHHGLFKRKLFNFGFPRQLIELVMEFISDINVSFVGEMQKRSYWKGEIPGFLRVL